MKIRAAAVTAALALLLAACSGGDGEPKPSGTPTASPTSEAPDLPALEEVWRLDGARPYVNNDAGIADGLWVGQGRVAVLLERQVTVVDAASGSQQGSVALRGRLCLAAPDINSDGVGAVLISPNQGGDCNTVVAIDVPRHRVLWRRTLPPTPYPTHVAVGDRTVAVTNQYDGARRLRIRDGEPLPTIGSPMAAANGRTIVAVDAARTTLTVYDQDSGRQRGGPIAVPKVYDFGEILRGPRVTVALSGARGKSFTEVFGGSAVRQVGRELDSESRRFARSVRVGGRTAVAYEPGTVIDMVDPATGDFERLTPLLPTERLVGVDGDRLITATDATRDSVVSQPVVRAIDPAQPNDPTVLGTVAQSFDTAFGGFNITTSDVIEGVLITVVRDAVVAHRLPDDGVATSTLEATADGDITAAQASDLCSGISGATLRTIGYRGTAGAPAGCSYYQSSASFPGARQVSLDVRSHAYPAVDDLTAVENAQAVQSVFTSPNSGRFTTLPDVGDEAAISADRTLMVVRVDNAVLQARLTGARSKPIRKGAALQQVMGDLLAELESRR